MLGNLAALADMPDRDEDTDIVPVRILTPHFALLVDSMPA